MHIVFKSFKQFNRFKLFRQYRAVNTPSQSQNPSVNSVYGLLRSVKFKGTSLAESYNLSDKIKLPFDEISWQLIHYSSCLFATSVVILVAVSQYFIAQYWIGLYLRCCLQIHIRDTPAISHLPPHTHIDHNKCKVGRELSITKDPLPAEPCAISAVSRYLY